jgi:hypothetical protein
MLKYCALKRFGMKCCDFKEGEAVPVCTRKVQRENRGITPLTLNLSCRCRRVVNLHSLAPLHAGKELMYPLSRRLVGPQSQSRSFEGEKRIPAPAGNWTPDCPAHSVVHKWTVLFTNGAREKPQKAQSVTMVSIPTKIWTWHLQNRS